MLAGHPRPSPGLCVYICDCPGQLGTLKAQKRALLPFPLQNKEYLPLTSVFLNILMNYSTHQKLNVYKSIIMLFTCLLVISFLFSLLEIFNLHSEGGEYFTFTHLI